LEWFREAELQHSRWAMLGFSPAELPEKSGVAAMRLILMALGYEKEIVSVFRELPEADYSVLADELSMTGRKQPFEDVPCAHTAGPAFLVYYGPAFLQKSKAAKCKTALSILAAVLRAARNLFPLTPIRLEDTVTIRIDALKVLDPDEVMSSAPWHVLRTSRNEAIVARGPSPDVNGTPICLLEKADSEKMKPDAKGASAAEVDDSDLSLKVITRSNFQTRVLDAEEPVSLLYV